MSSHDLSLAYRDPFDLELKESSSLPTHHYLRPSLGHAEWLIWESEGDAHSGDHTQQERPSDHVFIYSWSRLYSAPFAVWVITNNVLLSASASSSGISITWNHKNPSEYKIWTQVHLNSKPVYVLSASEEERKERGGAEKKYFLLNLLIFQSELPRVSKEMA